MRRSEVRVRRTSRGDFELRLPDEERALLRGLPDEMRRVLDASDPAADRLFPPAYPDDPDRDAEYRRMTRDDLRAGRLSSLEVMEATIDAGRIDEDQLIAWLGALNDLRLVLGTRLGVTEDLDEDRLDDPKDGPAYGLYHYLGWLESQVVDALAEGLDPAGSEG
ncbi:MAG: DUF2017 domain-containing protein [Actinomycetota bacterium]|nr:DUF2017 domain-containing protein [Actinomycetota bacterium]